MKKKVFLWIACIVVACVALAMIITTQIRINDAEEERKKLEAERDALLAENERLEHDLNMDVTDEYIIRMMRKLGYYFPGEESITFKAGASSEDEE